MGQALEAHIPEEWLRKLAERYLAEEEKQQIEAMGWDKLLETLEGTSQGAAGRHQGGSKWIGTAGTSPFGAYGYNPEGIRIGQDGNRNFRAVKVWDKREFKDFDDGVELGVRNMRIALRRLRRFARTGAAEELDLDGTIHETAHKGYLDVKLRPERRNAVKVLLFLDVGGSMDWRRDRGGAVFRRPARVQALRALLLPQLPLRARVEGEPPPLRPGDPDARPHPHLPVRLPRRVRGRRLDVPYEITMPGGSVGIGTRRPGELDGAPPRPLPKAVWLNPIPAKHWDYTHSIALVRKLLHDRMYPLTLEGIDHAMRELVR